MASRVSIGDPAKLPALKFYKDAVADIIAGRKTLEPRPRSMPWVRRLEQAGYAALTYGPRFGTPTIFAVARITDITIRPFGTADAGDLARIGSTWQERVPEELPVSTPTGSQRIWLRDTRWPGSALR